MPEAIYDVAIIGGGAAGSTAASLLGRVGQRVIVCEREKFPRFHIGESLLPVSMNTFTRLGLHEKFERAGFLKKYGGEMTSACCEEGVKFYFKDGYRSQTESPYQVPRAEFDKVLLDHAVENGAEMREQTPVRGVEFFSDRVELQLQSKSATPERISARYIISGSFAIRWRMAAFYFIVWLQRYLMLCPRRTLAAPKIDQATPQLLQPAA